MVYLFLADGFEEVEALATLDILKRAKVNILTVAIGQENIVRGAHDINVKADLMYSEINAREIEAVILPGGQPGTTNLAECEQLKNLLIELNKQGILIAAICAAPTVLAVCGILNNRKATSYPGYEDELELNGAEYSNENVIVSDNVVTSRAVGTVFDFSLKLVEILKGKETASKIKASICLR